MRFWWREIAGWLLVGLGLYVFYLTMLFLLGRQILEAGPMTVIGFILFRGGIHLLKVAVAAQVCMHTQERLAKMPAQAPKPKSKPDRHLGGRFSSMLGPLTK